ncbi:hypothetical protein KSE_25710 [Kitasatospora setae KM-6054]|uniref:PknH-like extracellular domain-containing protein n=1 Tax=Kitasatospora setae (strain ATCC 33774 / DSM 43861 / JCM 3304 / KCC A-0304 / NBRC 14216 / KM-6054) TaxID=452652 RepID=E4NB03_KITSK|nr:hypothetical protein KSE_25710 [Kitasatospora setae KM-6054]
MAVAVVLGAAGCASGGGDAVAGRAPRELRDGLLTAERLPAGYGLVTGADDSDDSDGSDGSGGSGGSDPLDRQPTESLARMPCEELNSTPFLARYAPALEEAAVGLAGLPAAGGSRGWYGRQSLERYPPGRAAGVLADLRAVALRCASPGPVFADGVRSERRVTVEPLGGGLLLRAAQVDAAGDPVLTDRIAVLRDGDVLLVVQEVAGRGEAERLPILVDAAVAAYRAAPRP